MRSSIAFLFISIISFSMVSCKDEKSAPETKKGDILFENLDTTVSPSQDFFQYANGGWFKKNPIPNDRSSWGIGDLVQEENYKRFKEINEKALSSTASKGTNDQKIRDFYKTAMDSAKADRLGLQPLQHLFDQVNTITDLRSLIATVAELKKIGSSTLFNDFVTQDNRRSDVMAYTLWQGGIGLPEREYYFMTDSSSVNIRNGYTNLISKVLTMSGEESAAAMVDSKNILALETKLAQASRKRELLRDDYKNYNKMAISDLPKLAPSIDWTTYLNIVGVKGIDSVIVGQPEFFKALDNILKTTPIPTLKSYVKVHLIASFSDELPQAFVKETFHFVQLFTGAKEMRPRWKKVIGQENFLMGEIFGQLYVKEFVSEKDKQRYVVMTEAIRDALKDHISKLTWMSDSTKQKAYEKLAAIKKKVFYPDKWKDYSAMDIDTESYVKNVINANEWRHNYQFNKLGKPVDREEWGMTPQTYNASYDPSNNDITLPAAQFIVPGYKDEDLDDALVYGYAAASTIGHEITHGFDDQGRKFDAIGNLSKWWTDKDSVEFTKRAQMIIKQFNEFEPLKGFHVNGEESQGENIADLGGILLGIDAFKKTEQYKEGKKTNGLTPMQRFFLGYTLGWLFEMQEAQLRTSLLTDEHAPAKYRVNGPFQDVDEFYSTFNIKPGDPMYRPDSLRARIW